MYISVKVSAKSKVEYVKRVGDRRFHVAVKAPPERGLVNERVCELLSSYIGIPRKSVRIASGHHSPSKLLVIPDNSEFEVI